MILPQASKWKETYFVVSKILGHFDTVAEPFINLLMIFQSVQSTG